MERKRPNIVLLFTDQQRYDTIHALGNAQIRTPAMDRLAEEGTAFTRCFTPSPVCVAARTALVTGMPPHRTGCVDNMPHRGASASFMQRLSDAGYQTHGVGKMHFTPDPRRMWGFQSRDFSEEGVSGDDFELFLRARGYEHVDEPHGIRSEMYYVPQPSQLPAGLHHTKWTADRSIDFLAGRDRGRPFMLWTSFIKPHPPFESPTPWNKLYRAAEMAAPLRPEGFEELLSYWNRVQNRYKWRDHGYDELLLRTMRAAYYSCISFIDCQIGRILDALGEEIDNTLILFSSDHGELLGDYGSVGKRCMLDAAARVPMLARYPQRFAAGGRCDEPTSLLDIYPTFLDAAGVGQAQVCEEGQSLFDVAGGCSTRQVVYSQFQQGRFGLYMAAAREHKYVYSAADQREWYFDLQADAKETHNRAGNPQSAQAVARLRGWLIERFKRDGYTAPLDGNGWRVHEPVAFPVEPDAGLLFQDPAQTQQRVDALGDGYARAVTVEAEQSMRLLRTEG